MKKAILLFLLFFSLFPYLKNGRILIGELNTVCAQNYGSETPDVTVCATAPEYDSYTVDNGDGTHTTVDCYTPTHACDEPGDQQCTMYTWGDVTPVDCNNDPYGTAHDSPCGCVGGNTGLEESWCYDCTNTPYGTAHFDDCNNCVGGNTGLTDCVIDPVDDPCAAFKDWVSKHSKGSGAYYDNNTGQKIQAGVCTNEAQSCILNSQYWYVDGTQKFYWRSVFLSNKWIEYSDCGINCLPIEFDFTHNVTPATSSTITNSNWCVFACMETLKGGTACTYATYYYSTYKTGITGCNADVGVESGDLVGLFTHFGSTPTSVNITSECDMINALNGGGKAILDVSPGHLSLVYGVHRDDKGKVTIDLFNTQDPSGVWNQQGIDFSYYNQGGGDYVTQ